MDKSGCLIPRVEMDSEKFINRPLSLHPLPSQLKNSKLNNLWWCKKGCRNQGFGSVSVWTAIAEFRRAPKPIPADKPSIKYPGTHTGDV